MKMKVLDRILKWFPQIYGRGAESFDMAKDTDHLRVLVNMVQNKHLPLNAENSLFG
jgi:hypothetical protein